MKTQKVFLIPCSDYKDINPIDSGYQVCPPDFHYGPSARNYTILHFVVSGKGILRKNGVEKTVEASRCFIIRSGEHAYYKSDSADPWTYIWLGFRTSLPLPEQIAVQDVIDAHEYENVFLSIMRHSNDEPALSAFLCSKCWELFSLMSAEQKAADSSDIMQKTKTFIENEYMNDISVAEIASMLFVDRTVLSKAFKKQTGKSPQEYICDYRLAMAKRLIQNGNDTLSGIAAMCGYKDYCNFSRMFSRKYGIAPREYAKAQTNISRQTAAQRR